MVLSRRRQGTNSDVSNVDSAAEYLRRRSMAGRVLEANESAATNGDKLWGVWAAILLTWIVVHSLAFVVVQYGFFKGTQQFYLGEGTFPYYFVPRTLSPAASCAAGLKRSGFDISDPHLEKWMDESSLLELAQTGDWTGPSEIAEYVKYVTHPNFYQVFKRSSPREITPVRFSEDECHVLLTSAIISQTKPNLGNPGSCLEVVRGIAIHYTLNPFHVNRVYVDYPSGFIEESFAHLDSNDIRDYVCDVMESHCTDTFKHNNFTSGDDCKIAYDNLPKNLTDGGYLDGKTKGCRILHSAFAAENSDHCPHLSFAPMEDKKGRTLCQESKRRRPSDVFSQYELDTMAEIAYKMGFPESLYRSCEYDPNRTADSPFDERPTLLRATDSVPLSHFNDGQFQVYVTFIMWITLVLSGVGTEYLVWQMFLHGDWNDAKELKWRAAQFIFPLLSLTALGLAITGDFWALPVLVAAMWKLGFPETILLFYSALHEKSISRGMRAVDSINAVGTIIHHSSASLCVSALLSNVIYPNRDVLQSILPLVMQHWFILLRYNHRAIYVTVEVTLEIWFEWSLFSSLENIDNLHWIWGVLAMSMVFAHWCYFIAGGISLVLPLFASEAQLECDGMERLTALHHRRTSAILASIKSGDHDGKKEKCEELEKVVEDTL